MESIIKKLGKASVTVEKDYHNSEKEYNKLTIVEEKDTFKTYLSRKPVPVGIALTNREYWICFSGVLESITFDYLKFKKDYASGKAIEDNAIITRHILDRNIERIKIALKTISEEEIDDNAIIERTIKDRNITSNKIAKENILTEHFAKKSVITSILADYIITAIKLADNSVTTRSIADENITDIKLANNAVTTRSIAQESIIEEKFANNSVSTRSLIDKSVTKEKLAENSVTESKIADNNITNRKIANNTIDITKFDSYTRNIIESVRYIPEEFASIKEAIFDEINKYKPIIINGDVTNAADEEDITSENNLLKLKDRSALNGMGYVILRKNKSFAEQLAQANTIYEIRYDFDLNGAEITIPENCVLKFNGGSIKNGIVRGNNTLLIGSINITYIEGTFINNTLYSNCISEPNNYRKLKGLLEAGAKTVVLEEDFFINEFNERILSNSNIEGENNTIYFNTDIQKNQTMSTFIEFNNLEKFNSVNVNGNGYSCLCVFSFKGVDNLSINNVSISNIDNRKFTKTPSHCVCINIRVNDKSKLLVNKVNISNIKTEANNIIADSDGNITGILVYIPSNLESLINISNLEFKELHNYKNEQIATEDVSCLYISQEKPYNTNKVICNINNIKGYNFGKRLIKTNADNINIDTVIAENYINDSLSVIGLNNGDVASAEETPHNAIIKNVSFKGGTAHIIATSMPNTIIDNITVDCSILLPVNKLTSIIYGARTSNIVKASNISSIGSILLCFAESCLIEINNIRFNDTTYEDTVYENRFFIFKNASITIKNANIITNKITSFLDDIYDDLYNNSCNFVFENVTLDWSVPNQSYSEVLSLMGTKGSKKVASLSLINCTINAKEALRTIVKISKNHKLYINGLIVNIEKRMNLTTAMNLELANNNININNIIFHGLKGEENINILDMYIKSDTEGPYYANNIQGIDMVSTPAKVYCIGNFIPKIKDINILNYSSEEIGTRIRDNNNNEYIWNGTFFYNIVSNTPYGALLTGSFNNRPNSSTGIKLGYAYFCTDRQTSEGASNGIMIYYKGNNIWIDALGRVVE